MDLPSIWEELRYAIHALQMIGHLPNHLKYLITF